MILCDVNIFIYARREDSPHHRFFRPWLEKALETETFGYSELVFSGFIRIVTHPRAFNPPTTLEGALEYCDSIRKHPNARAIHTGPKHFDIFADCCRAIKAQGNLIPDAYFAALAIENNCTWISLDNHYSRFPGLRWHNPLKS